MSATQPLNGVSATEASSGFDPRGEGPGLAPADTLLEVNPERHRRGRPTRRAGSGDWIGWRLRAVVLYALLGCVGLLLLARQVAELPVIGGTWRVNAQAGIELVASRNEALRPALEDTLVALTAASGERLVADPLWLQRSGRWIVSDADRRRHLAQMEALDRLRASGEVTLHFARSGAIDVKIAPLGLAGLGLLFWMLGTIALALFVLTAVVLMARPTLRNGPYAVMSLCQSASLLFMAVESVYSLGIGASLARWDFMARTVLDLVTVASVISGACIFPLRLPHAGKIIASAWLASAAFSFGVLEGSLAPAWWWTQGACGLLGAVTIGLLGWSHRVEPHPIAVALRRFVWFGVGSWLLLTFAAGASGGSHGLGQSVPGVGSVIWTVFMASLLLLLPFLSRSQHVVREFALIALVSTAATALDLVFVVAFSFGQFASLTLALFFALALYAAARQWVMLHVLGDGAPSMERVFDQLYRVAREVQAQPERIEAALLRLLRELFDPLEAKPAPRRADVSWVLADGSTLFVPVPRLQEAGRRNDGALMLRFARRGRRLFTAEDARLADRIVDQLRHMVAFDLAVEHGRSEERARIAQDLHDDIGARLLTMIYKSPTPEMEDYVRHTLQDLKTLTRGLAAREHRLSHAAAEWKRDLVQRLEIAHCDLQWNCTMDRDAELNVVQWSGLTRVLRELVNNTIAHARATQVEINLQLQGDRIELSVRDNGIGRDPASWAHGLGLSGVRKRVKQLGGVVEWREVPAGGIECRVRIAKLAFRS